MSEQQVLPEFIATLKAAAEKATGGQWSRSRLSSLNIVSESQQRTVASTFTHTVAGSSDDGSNAEFIAQASPENILKLIASLAQSEAERERLQGELGKVRDVANFWLDAHARERELNQGLRQVAQAVMDLSYRCLKVEALMQGPKPSLKNLNYLAVALHALNIKADSLLEDKSKPVVTNTEEEK